VGYPTIRNAVQIGRIGELIAQAVLEENGYKTARVNHVGFDLLMFDDDGLPIKVEVKSSSRAYEKSYKFATASGSKNKKLLSPNDCDIVIMVALDLRRVVVRDVMELKHKRTSLGTCHFLDSGSEATQIRKAVQKYRSRKC
jgi:Holliday junction resolvase-like predicted endonuclease